MSAMKNFKKKKQRGNLHKSTLARAIDNKKGIIRLNSKPLPGGLDKIERQQDGHCWSKTNNNKTHKKWSNQIKALYGMGYIGEYDI